MRRAASKRAENSEPTTSQLIMKCETQVRYGVVPHALAGEPLAEQSWQMAGDRFLLRGEGQHYFYYQKGDGITVERGPGVDSTEESLWLNGSVYSAVASINGLLPMHASAVVFDHAVFAFAGPAGAGKSTLAAALGQHGLPMFCDDTLVLDLTETDRTICLPGHKRLKLSPDAVRLTGSMGQERVSKSLEKVYADPPAGHWQSPLPLGEVIFLEEGPESAVRPINGAQRLLRLQDDHHTSNLFSCARGFNRDDSFRHLVRVSQRIQMAVFTRPRDLARFDKAVSVALDYLARSSRVEARQP